MNRGKETGGGIGVRGREEQKATRQRWDPVTRPREPRVGRRGCGEERKADDFDGYLYVYVISTL